jgi:hypothetical protein
MVSAFDQRVACWTPNRRRVSALLVALYFSIQPALSVAAESPADKAPHIGEGGLPLFERDTSWLKPPAAWTRGAAVSSVDIDERGHLWLVTRPRVLGKPGTVPKAELPPPVIEFDDQGNFVRGWGGENGPGYLWPSIEHGLIVGPTGFVWIVGSAFGNPSIDDPNRDPAHATNDTQILKFTTAGKFVMAIGKPGLLGSNKTEVVNGPSNTFYYAATHELFVSDGYGNNRVMVYDADTGKLKRMWGAYGKKPLDKTEWSAKALPALMESGKLWAPVTNALQQFQEPHDVKVSKDGLVYVADRGNRRIQVFTLDGKFITEQFIGLGSKYEFQARNLAFSPDQRFLYAGGTGIVYILNRLTLEVLGTFDIGGLGARGRTPGHILSVDSNGNIYLTQPDNAGLDGNSVVVGLYRYLFKGYSPTTSCCKGGGGGASPQ